MPSVARDGRQKPRPRRSRRRDAGRGILRASLAVGGASAPLSARRESSPGHVRAAYTTQGTFPHALSHLTLPAAPSWGGASRYPVASLVFRQVTRGRRCGLAGDVAGQASSAPPWALGWDGCFSRACAEAFGSHRPEPAATPTQATAKGKGHPLLLGAWKDLPGNSRWNTRADRVRQAPPVTALPKPKRPQKAWIGAADPLGAVIPCRCRRACPLTWPTQGL